MMMMETSCLNPIFRKTPKSKQAGKQLEKIRKHIFLTQSLLCLIILAFFVSFGGGQR
ncbi:MAG: hypothetical protein QMC80_04425 [Thermoplasmatales archaeon]|nr:hypothetical protein [Thermoplasmatales archaeon]